MIRPWQGIPFLVDKDARDVFNSLVCITVREGLKVLFWKDRWLQGKTIAECTPNISYWCPPGLKTNVRLHKH